MAYQVKVLNAALDVMRVGDKDQMVLRGVIDPGSFADIKIGDYQREAGSLSDLGGLVAAFKAGEQVPDIEIGVRGDKISERAGAFYIHSDCFVIDGLQRLTAGKRVLAEFGMEAKFRLGATFHLDSDEDWERNRFKILNLRRRRVSPNVILRNWKESPAVQALYVMTTDGRGDFVLKGRVSWGQKMGRGELLPALSALRTVGILHNQFGPGLSTSLDQLVPAVDKTFQVVGPNVWRSNVRTFFDVVDHAFGLKSIAYRDLSPHLKGGFLRALARVFADHQTFWEDHRLKIDPKDLAKLRQFPIRDPGIMDLANSNSGVNETLYAKIVQFMNAYRKTNYLRKWNGQKADGVLNMEQSSEGGDFSDSELPEPAEAT